MTLRDKQFVRRNENYPLCASVVTMAWLSDKIFIAKSGRGEKFSAITGKRRPVRFPLSVALTKDDGTPEVYTDFVLNVSRGGVFIKTDSPHPAGSRLEVHFYIPPGEKLLGEFLGEVLPLRGSGISYPSGMHVRFAEQTKDELTKLSDYMEEKRPLVSHTV